MDDWAPQFKSLLSSPLGAELLRTLREDLHDNLVGDAEDSETQESAFGLLKQAGGVIKAIEHLQFRAVAPTDEGGKVK
jgi:hypothetical protein